MDKVWPRVIFHVDMDAFFAAVEQLKNPEYRGKPVIVGAEPKEGEGRGVVSTASYEARAFGVHSAMPISRAYNLCPHGIYVYPNGKLYGEFSRQIFEILETFTPQIQKISIDEAFLDVTGQRMLIDGKHTTTAVKRLGETVKKRVFSETGLTASIGVATTKSVAKIASDMDKPDGLTIVTPDSVREFLDPLPVTKIWGVGRKTFQTLTRLGIQIVRQLREYPLDALEKKFGKMGSHLHRMAKGIDEREVSTREEIKSISHETTFLKDQTDRELLISTLMLLSEKVSIRLRKHGFRGKTIQIKLRFNDFSTFTRSKTLPDPTHLTEQIFAVSKRLFEQFDNVQKPVRLIGVGVSQLQSEAGLQLSLWDVENRRKSDLEKIMDELQQKYGKKALTHAETLTARKKRQS